MVDLNTMGASLDFPGFTFRYDRDLQGRPWRYLNVFPSKWQQFSGKPDAGNPDVRFDEWGGGGLCMACVY